MTDHAFYKLCDSTCERNIEQGRRPFGAVIVKHGIVVSTGVNQILICGDPTSHAS